MSGLADQKFGFEDVVVDAHANLLMVAGKEKRVEPKLIALLVYLAQHPKQVISRQQITETIWPKVVVGDESVTQAIFALRNLLGDDAKQPRYIETIPKKGYRFLADVILFTEPSLNISHTRDYSKSKLTLISASIALIVVAASLLIWLFAWKTPYGKIANILPATKMEGVEGDMAVNNKHQMVFISSSLKGNTLYLKDLNTGVQEPITKNDWFIAPQPAWLNDETLLYSRCKFNSHCQIVRQKLREQPNVLYESDTGIVEVVVRPDRPHELFFNESSKEDLGVFDTVAGKYERLRDRYTNLPNYISHPQFTRDGKRLYFVYKAEQIKLMALDLTNGAIKTISEQFEELHSISFNHKQQLIIAGNINSTAGLWFLDPDGGEPKLFLRAVNGELYVRAAIAPNEPVIYCQTVRLNFDNIVFDQGKDITNELPNFNSTGMDLGAIFSHDNQFIYFISNRSGFTEIWRYDLANKQEKPVTQIKTALIESLSLSHNGQRIAAVYMDKTQLVTGIFSTFTGELLAKNNAKLLPINWSNDDQTIYVVDAKDIGQRLLQMNSQTMQTTKVKEGASLYAEEINDGESLIFFDSDKNGFVKRSTNTGEEKALSNSITPTQLDYHIMRIDSLGQSLFTVYRDNKTNQLMQYFFDKATKNDTVSLLNLPLDTGLPSYINNTGTKVLSNRVVSVDGDMLKIELAH